MEDEHDIYILRQNALLLHKVEYPMSLLSHTGPLSQVAHSAMHACCLLPVSSSVTHQTAGLGNPHCQAVLALGVNCSGASDLSRFPPQLDYCDPLIS